MGQSFTRADPSDGPGDDGNACTEGSCRDDGEPKTSPLPAGQACGENKICSGTGICSGLP